MEKTMSRLEHQLPIAVTLALTAIAHDLVGPWVYFNKSTVLIILAMVGFVSVAYTRWTRRRLEPAAAVAALVLFGLSWVIFWRWHQTGYVAGLAVFLFYLSTLAIRRDDGKTLSRELTCMCLFLVVTGLLQYFLHEEIGPLWMAWHGICTRLSHAVNPAILMGPTATMLTITLYLILFLGTYTIAFGRRTGLRAVVLAGLLLGANLLFLRLASRVPAPYWNIGWGPSSFLEETTKGDPIPNYLSGNVLKFTSMFDASFAYAALGILLIGGLIVRHTANEKESAGAGPGLSRISLLLLAISANVGLYLVLTQPPRYDSLADAKIAIYCPWDVSTMPRYQGYQGYGLISTGMYGLLLSDLAQRGAKLTDLTPKQDQVAMGPKPVNAKPTAREEPPANVFASAGQYDVIIIMVPSRAFTQAEEASLRQYLEAGGNLLLVGDHTNLEGCQRPFNDLAKPYGVTLEFDSAFSLIRWWANNVQQSIRYPFKPDDPLCHGMGTGGSLTVRRPAVPLWTARYAFGDLGNIFKSSRQDAFLGDYTYQHGELLSDVVLAAQARVGDGRIVAFGDSSGFQNIAYGQSGRAVRALLGWIIDTSVGERVFRKIRYAIPATLLLLLGFVLPVPRKIVWGIAATPVFLLLIFVVWPRAGIAAEPLPVRYAQIYLPRQTLVNRDRFKKTSYLGLSINLNRLGYVADWTSRLDDVRRGTPDILCIPAPAQPFSRRERDILENFMEDGGIVIVTAGHDLERPLHGFLSSVQLEIKDVPLGGEYLAPSKPTVEFVNAWELASNSSDAHVLYRRYGKPAVIFRRVGQGGLLLLGDSQFFSDHNLEEEKSGKALNIIFFKTLIERVCSGVYEEITLEDVNEAMAATVPGPQPDGSLPNDTSADEVLR